MSGLMRDMFNTLTRSANADTITRDSEALAHLDDRLSGLAPADGAARCARSVRPEDCTIWPGNLTDRAGPTAETCKGLIDSIAKEGGNLVPVVVRPLPKGAERPFELLVGNRRRFAVDWLNRNGRPEIRLNALVVDLSDEEAFRLADIENQEREDIAELDRARSYRQALDRFYDGVQSRMADALRLSNSQLSRLLALADLPEEIVAAFPTADELRVRHSEVLTPLLRQSDRRPAVIAEAIRIGKEQEDLCAQGEKLVPAAAVLGRLRDAGSDRPAASTDYSIDAFAQEIGSLESFPGGIAVDLVVPDFANIDEVLARLKEALVQARREAGDKG